MFTQDPQMSSFTISSLDSGCHRFLSPNYPRLDGCLFNLAFYSWVFPLFILTLIKAQELLAITLFLTHIPIQLPYYVVRVGYFKKLNISKNLFSVREKQEKLKAKPTHRKIENS